MDLAERGAYYAVALFVLSTIIMVFASVAISLSDVVEVGPLGAALEVLDKVLLIFIFAELLGTISTIVREREVTAEPFLLIGLIAVVRRILAVTVSIEQNLGTVAIRRPYPGTWRPHRAGPRPRRRPLLRPPDGPREVVSTTFKSQGRLVNLRRAGPVAQW